jgi:transcriptional regulator with XRE-family HTH domain
MTNEVLKKTREKIGEYLSEVREESGVSYYAIQKQTGLRYEQAKAIESGSENYTIDSLLKMAVSLDLYVFFAPRDGRHLDFEDMADKLNNKK